MLMLQHLHAQLSWSEHAENENKWSIRVTTLFNVPDDVSVDFNKKLRGHYRDLKKKLGSIYMYTDVSFYSMEASGICA